MNKDKKLRRKLRVRVKIRGTSKCPRLSVFRSNRYIYAQLIDDENRKTLIGVSEKELENKNQKENKSKVANKLGLLLAKKASEKKINSAIFDRGFYLYHGRVKEVAEGAREGGLKF